MSVGLARTGVWMLLMPAHLRPGTRRVPVQTTESPRNREEMHSHTGCVSAQRAWTQDVCQRTVCGESKSGCSGNNDCPPPHRVWLK